MTADPSQMELFASWTSPSSSSAPTSPRSSELETPSSDATPSAPGNATSTTATDRAPARATRAGAGSAAKPSSSAKSTVVSGEQATLSICIETRHTPDPVLAIARPQTWADCQREREEWGEKCPWVGCKHHVLLEIARSKGGDDQRATTIRLNRPRVLYGVPLHRSGRRAGLSASATYEELVVFGDDAIELLELMPYTCTLRVTELYPDGISERSVGRVMGMSEAAAHAAIKGAKERVRAELAELDQEDDDLE